MRLVDCRIGRFRDESTLRKGGRSESRDDEGRIEFGLGFVDWETRLSKNGLREQSC